MTRRRASRSLPRRCSPWAPGSCRRDQRSARLELVGRSALLVRGTQDAARDVVIVGIDDKTLDAGGGSTLPLDRTRHAESSSS